MNKELKKIIRVTSGVLILLLGIIGLFLPVLQGVAMIILGIHLIYPDKAKKIIRKGRKMFNGKFKKEKSD